MECLYRIIGIAILGNRIVLSISPIEDEKELSTKDILNVGKFMQTIQNKTAKSKHPDKISINVDDFEKNDYRINDIVSVSVIKGK